MCPACYIQPPSKKKKKVPPPLWNNKAMYSYFIYVLSSPEPSKTYAPQTQTHSHPQTQVFLQISLPVFHVIPENKIYFSAFCAVEHQLPLFCCHQTHTHTHTSTHCLFLSSRQRRDQTNMICSLTCLSFYTYSVEIPSNTTETESHTSQQDIFSHVNKVN